MQGDVVKAAKWLGGSLVAASLVCVVGFHPAVTGRTIQIQKVDTRPAATSEDAPVHLTPERVHGGITIPPAPGPVNVSVLAPVEVPSGDTIVILPPSMSPADRVECKPAGGVCGMIALPAPCPPVTPTSGGVSSVSVSWGTGE